MPRTPRRTTPRSTASAKATLTASGYAGPVAPPPAAAPQPRLRPGIELPGVRKSANAWWCPVDGTAQKLDRNGIADPCPVCKRSLDYYESKVEAEPEVAPADE